MVVKVILWTAPRCVSTAFQRSISTLTNAKVLYEPFLRPFYYGPDKQREVFPHSSMANDTSITYQNAKSSLCQDYEGFGLIFSKDMAYYMQNKFDILLEDGFKDFKHSFLIRDPAQAILSLYRGCINSGGYDFHNADNGFRELYELYQFVTENLDPNPVVVDANDLLDKPSEVMKSYCEAVGIQYEASMTTWEPGFWPCASPGFSTSWHYNVRNSSGFIPRSKGQEGSRKEVLPEEVVKAIEEATPFYNHLALRKLNPMCP